MDKIESNENGQIFNSDLVKTERITNITPSLARPTYNSVETQESNQSEQLKQKYTILTKSQEIDRDLEELKQNMLNSKAFQNSKMNIEDMYQQKRQHVFYDSIGDHKVKKQIAIDGDDPLSIDQMEISEEVEPVCLKATPLREREALQLGIEVVDKGHSFVKKVHVSPLNVDLQNLGSTPQIGAPHTRQGTDRERDTGTSDLQFKELPGFVKKESLPVNRFTLDSEEEEKFTDQYSSPMKQKFSQKTQQQVQRRVRELLDSEKKQKLRPMKVKKDQQVFKGFEEFAFDQISV